MISTKHILLMIVMAFITLTACTTTQMAGTWENRENFRPAVDDVVVVVLSGRPEIRRVVEQDIVEQLTQREVRALPGSPFLSGGKDQWLQVPWLKLKEENIRFALVISEFRREGLQSRPRAVNVPDDYLEFYEYYSHSNSVPNVQEYLGSYQGVSVETNLYDIGNRQLVMSNISDTIKKDDLNEVIHNFVREILQHMAEKGYLKK